MAFPLAPTVGQTYTDAGITWTWNGKAWTVNIAAPGGGTSTPSAGVAALAFVLYETVDDRALDATSGRALLLRRFVGQSTFAGARTDHPAGRIDVESFGELTDESGTVTTFTPATSGLYLLEMALKARTATAAAETITAYVDSPAGQVGSQSVTIQPGTSARSVSMLLPLTGGTAYTLGAVGPSVLLAGSGVKVVRLGDVQFVTADVPPSSSVVDATITAVIANSFAAPNGSGHVVNTVFYVTVSASRALAAGEQFALYDDFDGTATYLAANGATSATLNKTLTAAGTHPLRGGVINATTGQAFPPSAAWTINIT